MWTAESVARIAMTGRCTVVQCFLRPEDLPASPHCHCLSDSRYPITAAPLTFTLTHISPTYEYAREQAISPCPRGKTSRLGSPDGQALKNIQQFSFDFFLVIAISIQSHPLAPCSKAMAVNIVHRPWSRPRAGELP